MFSVKENPEITTNEFFQHLSYLASDSLKGRLPGTEEDRLAALYIADEFSKAGLQLMGDGGLQAFEVITDLETGATNYLRIGETDAGCRKISALSHLQQIQNSLPALFLQVMVSRSKMKPFNGMIMPALM